MTEDTCVSNVEVIAPEALEQIRALYDRGLYLQAYQRAVEIGLFDRWSSPQEGLLAARLADKVGNERVLRAWVWKLHRRYPRDDEIAPYYGSLLLDRVGPWKAWCWMNAYGNLAESADPETRIHWLTLRASIMSMVRDFARADAFLNEALSIDANSAWALSTKVRLLIREDRYQEAMQLAEEILARRPWYVPALNIVVSLLTLQEKDEEARQFVLDAERHVECYFLTLQRATIEWEQQRWDELEQTVALAERLAPMADRNVREWILSIRFYIEYHRGNYQQAQEYARQGRDAFLKECAERLSDERRLARKTVELPVGFVRQHHVTCGPATLAAISRYWQMPVDHLQIAQQICYDGTTNYHERWWAENNGWYAREFTVTEEAAEALLERGVPFTLTTTEPNSAHLQAVIGCDGKLGTLDIRDPYYRPKGFCLADKFLERYRAWGPRGMALVPQAEKHRLEDLQLPDVELWDLLYRLNAALEHHDRQTAEQCLAQFQATAPDHFLTQHARIQMAIYDSNPISALEAWDNLCRQFPNNVALHVRRYSFQRDILPQRERIEQLRNYCRGELSHPVFWARLGVELGEDASCYPEAMRWLAKACRAMPAEASNYYHLAGLYAAQRRFDEAIELYRWAACLDDKNEEFARSYFVTCRMQNRVEEALDFLRSRFDRYAQRSSWPARSLISAYWDLDRAEDAERVLYEALTLRPEDGELLSFAVRFRQGWGDTYRQEIETYLERARSRVSRDAYLRMVGTIAENDGRVREALQHWQELLALQPLAVDAYEAVARLTEATQGAEAALRFLEDSVERFPHYQPLHELWMTYARQQPQPYREGVLRRLATLAPESGGVHLELAECLAFQRRWSEAMQEADEAAQRNPYLPMLPVVRAQILFGQDQWEEGRVILRKALETNIDNGAAIFSLLESHDSSSHKKQELSFIFEQLRRQIATPSSIIAYCSWANSVLEPEQFEEQLLEAVQARPDLWPLGYFLAQHYLQKPDVNKALEVARSYTERFPLIARLWLCRAEAARVAGHLEEEREALETAYRLNPSWEPSVSQWAQFLIRQANHQEAVHVLEQAAIRAPGDAGIQWLWVSMLWELDRHQEAFERALFLLRSGKENAQHWEKVLNWSDFLNCREKVIEVARYLTEQRSGEPRVWLELASVLVNPENHRERLAALERALQLDPWNIEAHDLRAETLAWLGRWDEAENACRPEIYEGEVPVQLRLRLARLKYLQEDYPSALELVRQIVQEEPRYSEAWYWAYQFSTAADDKTGAIEAAEKLVELDPNNVVALTELGKAYKNADRDEDALKCLERAWQLSPEHVECGMLLAELLLKKKRIAEARDVLESLAVFDTTHRATVVWIDLAHQMKDRRLAIEKLQTLVNTLDADPETIAASLVAMDRAKWRKACWQVLDRAVQVAAPSSVLVHSWATVSGLLGKHHCLRRMLELAPTSPTMAEGLASYTINFSHNFSKSRPLACRWFLMRYESRLCAHTDGWAGVLIMNMDLGRWRRALALSEQWRNYSDPDPYMLINVGLTFLAMGKCDAAREAFQHVLTLPTDAATYLANLFLSVLALWDENLPEAQRMLRNAQLFLKDRQWQFVKEFMAVLLQALQELEQSPQDGIKTEHWRTMVRLAKTYADVRRWRYVRTFLWKSLQLLLRKDRSWRSKWQALRVWLGV